MRVLHIGYPKTGTTFMQTSVFRPLNKSGALPSYFGQSSREDAVLNKQLRLLSYGETLTDPELLRQLTSGAAGFFVSNETLIGQQTSIHDFNALADRLAVFFPVTPKSQSASELSNQ